MRVLAIQPFLQGYGIHPFPGGKSRLCHQLARHLVAQGHELYILPWLKERLFDPVRCSFSDEGHYATVLPTVHMPSARRLGASLASLLKSGSLLRNPRNALRSFPSRVAGSKSVALARAMKRAKPDLVHVHYTYSEFPHLYRRQRHSAPLILTHYTYGIGSDLDAYDHVVFMCESHREAACRTVPSVRSRSCAIYHPVRAEFHGDSGLGQEERMLFVSSLHSHRHAEGKRLELLLDAYVADGALDRWPLHVVGDGPPRADYERRARRRGLNVVFEGQLPADKIAALMARCRALVVPSVREGFAVIYAEAACMGLPIVGYPPNVEDLSRQCGMEVGVAFDAVHGTAADLAAAIRRAMGPDGGFDLERRRELRRRAREVFAPGRAFRRYRQLYTEMVQD